MPKSIYAPDTKVEVAFNAGVRTPKASRTWTDVSDYVEFHRGIGITGGRADERSTCDANTASIVVDNSDGRFTPGLASSPYYPNVKIGRPIRVTAIYPPEPAANLLSAANANFESGVGGWTGTGTVAPTLSVDTVTKRYDSQSLKITWNGGGALPQAQVSTASLTASVTYTWAVWVYVPTGAPDVRLIASTSTGSLSAVKDTWHRLSLTFTQGASTTVTVGIRSSGTPSSTVCYADGGMLVYGSDVGDFNTLPPTTYIRFEGYVDEWPNEWGEQVDSYATTAITASSRLARLGASTKLRSVVEQTVIALGPVSYYPLGEPEGSTSASDVSGNGADPLVVTGTGAAVNFAAATGLSTDGLQSPTMTGKKYLKDSYSASSSLGVTLSIFFRNGDYTADVADEVFSAIGVQLSIDSGGTVIAFPKTATATATAAGAMPDNNWHHVAVRLNAAGSTITAWVDGVQVATASPTAHTPSGTAVIVGNNDNMAVASAFAVAHAAVFNYALADADITAIAAAGLTGLTGTADDVLATLATYAGVASAETDFDATAVTSIAHVNPAGQTNLEPMRKVEETEGGVLFDARDNTLTYVSRNARYTATSALSASMLTHDVEGNVTPRYDRSTLVNDATATLVNGSSYRVLDASSIDDYDPAESTIDLASNDPIEAAGAAGWRVSTYAQPTTRIPNLTLNLLNLTPTQIAAALSLDVGSLTTVADWPTQAASSSLSLFVEGYVDAIDLESYSLTLNVSPSDPWLNTLVLDSASRGLLDTYRLAY